MLNPLVASDRIEAEYRRYLLSTFPLRNRELREEFARRLATAEALSRGPFLQASPPFVLGRSVRELVEEGVLASAWLGLPEDAFPVDRPLYAHQEEAIRKAVSQRRNLMVTTGTGSGKTECFLIPIIDHLMREHEARTLRAPGVRALLLYPMNALANDQVKRLRSVLRYLPDITFGRYVGDTEEKEQAAEDDFARRYSGEPRLANELISREAMKERPPSILLTNYAMLEYLLLRPADSALFDGPTAGRWRFIALDEIHVYDGTQGAEVAMLLRRLRDRVNGTARGELQCFGTSATLGGGERDYPDLVRFASDLFDEPFEWNPADAGRQDIVAAQRRPLVRADADYELAPDSYRRIGEALHAGATAEDLSRLSQVSTAPAPGADSSQSYVADLLARDARSRALLTELEDGATSLRDAAAKVMGADPDAEQHLVDLVSLGVVARHRDDDAPVIPARYHFFLRALEGAFVCLHPEHDEREPKLLLSRHESCHSCARHGRGAKMFELGTCRRCGAEYAVGTLEKQDDGLVLVHARPTSMSHGRVLLGEPLPDDVDDEDEEAFAVAHGDHAVRGLLCPGCGTVGENDARPACGCDASARPIRVAIARLAAGEQAVRRCLSCARRSAGDVVMRFLTGSDAPVSVVATDLYQEIPPSDDPGLQNEVGRGRKLLTFADSRQDAAFFAPYLERTYRRAVERRLIQQAVAQLADDEPCLDDLLPRIRKRAEQELVIDPDETTTTRNSKVLTWLTRELMALDRRQSLEGTGVAEIRLRFPRRYETPQGLLRLGFTPAEADDLIRLLVDSVRLQGAVNAPDGVDLRSQAFAPRNVEISIRERGSASGLLAWMPGRGRNGRLDLLERVFERKGIQSSPGEALANIWRMFTARDSGWDKILVPVNDQRHGAAFRLDPSRFAFVPVGDDHTPLRCDTCRQIWWYAVGGACPSFRCTGTVEEVDDLAALLNDHYARLYQHLEPIGLTVEEHTAQWVSSEASRIQDKFVRGEVNVLSCSTTFELGVDVGEVQAVLLRNVPPTPANYVQRAGRAGRRTESAALVVCFAQRRSHDLYFFDRPTRMVDGRIPPPRVPLRNAPIARRHVHSVAVAAYQREVGPLARVHEFFIDADGGDSHDQRMVSWLREHPEALGAALARVVPKRLHESLGLATWAWVDALVERTDEDPTFGWLARAAGEIRSDAQTLEELKAAAVEKEHFKHAAYLQRVRSTVLGRPLLNFLASRNVLPKYGFPVDVVELSLARTGDALAGKLELSRDLEMAIRDYAPGSRVVAGKAMWKSRGLALRHGQTWPSYAWAVCGACGAFRHALEELPEECQACGAVAELEGGNFVIPIHGFQGERDSDQPGETQPRKTGFLESYFGNYGEAPPDLAGVPELGGDGNGSGERAPVTYRFSHQGLITVLNRGPSNGFFVCSWCGHGVPAHEFKKGKKHRSLERVGQDCEGNLRFVQLGHRYLTDVLEVRLDQPLQMEEAYSALYALTAATPALDIVRDDIDGTLDWFAPNHPAFILHDTVPGGAGHTQLLAKRLPELFAAAHERVSSCECGVETSCYSCLRSYRNQRYHERLNRGAALRVLESVVGDLAEASSR